MAVDIFNKYTTGNNLDSKIEVISSGGLAKTARGAAESVGCELSQIAKSLVVKIDDQFAVFITPGHVKLDLDEIKNKYNAVYVGMAAPDEVKHITGHSIGGVPPFGYINNLKIYIVDGFDSDLPVYAAAGHQGKTFKINYKDLENIISSINKDEDSKFERSKKDN